MNDTLLGADSHWCLSVGAGSLRVSGEGKCVPWPIIVSQTPDWSPLPVLPVCLGVVSRAPVPSEEAPVPSKWPT